MPVPDPPLRWLSDLCLFARKAPSDLPSYGDLVPTLYTDGDGAFEAAVHLLSLDEAPGDALPLEAHVA